jgi:hypothetical protein
MFVFLFHSSSPVLSSSLLRIACVTILRGCERTHASIVNLSPPPLAGPENKSKNVHTKVNPSDIMKSQRNRIINALPKLGNKLERTTRKLTIQETLNRIDPSGKAGSLGCTKQQRMLAYMIHSLMNVAWRKTSDAYQGGGVVHLRTRGCLGKLRRTRGGGTPIEMASMFQ